MFLGDNVLKNNLLDLLVYRFLILQNAKERNEKKLDNFVRTIPQTNFVSNQEKDPYL